MSQTRRQFCAMVGGAASVPLLWERAEAEVEQTGEVATDAVRMLRAQTQSIFTAAAVSTTTRSGSRSCCAAVARIIRSTRRLREFPIPQRTFSRRSSSGGADSWPTSSII